MAANNRKNCINDCDRKFSDSDNLEESPENSYAGLVRFAMADTDRSGRISKEQFHKFFMTISGRCAAKITEEQLDENFIAMDKDKSGDISLEEVDADAMSYAIKNYDTIKTVNGIDTTYVQKTAKTPTVDKK